MVAGRPKSERSAVCPHCRMSFEDVGKFRYRNLKRHIEGVHTSDVQGSGAIVNNNTLNNFGVILNVELRMSSVKACDLSALKECIRELLIECDEMNRARFPEMIAKLHELNMNAVIPNVNKDEMLLRLDRRVDIVPAIDGARMCVKAFSNEAPKEIGEFLSDTEKGYCEAIATRPDGTISDQASKALVKRMKAQSSESRRAITKNLRGSTGSQVMVNHQSINEIPKTF